MLEALSNLGLPPPLPFKHYPYCTVPFPYKYSTHVSNTVTHNYHGPEDYLVSSSTRSKVRILRRKSYFIPLQNIDGSIRSGPSPPTPFPPRFPRVTPPGC